MGGGKKGGDLLLRKFAAGMSLLVVVVTVVAGLKAEVRFVTIGYRACAAAFVVKVVCGVVIRVAASYEEIHSGKA